MTKKMNPKRFLTWLHINRIKIILSLFLIVVPIALIASAYIGTYVASQRVFFDQEATDATQYIKDFVSPDELDAMNVIISWDELRHPTENTEGVLINGQYGFYIRYESKPTYVLSNVRITPLLQTDWAKMRSLGTERSLTTSNSMMRVPFNYVLPDNPLWFVTVNEPHLYLKITYTRELALTSVDEIVYVKYVLKDIIPPNIF